MAASTIRSQAIGAACALRACTRRFAQVVQTCALAAALLVGANAGAADPEHVRIFDRAEFALGEGSRPPQEGAAWQSVALPHEWRHTHPGAAGQGWYRIRFHLTERPAIMQALMLVHERSQESGFVLNGNGIGGARDLLASARIGPGLGSPLYLSVPPALLRPGENVLLVRMRTAFHPANIQGLGVLMFGDARPVRRATAAHWETGFYAERGFAAMAFAAGLITLVVWFARRGDRVMLWFSIACLSWSFANVLRYWLRWSDLSPVIPVLTPYAIYGLVVPAVILCLRTVDLRWPRFEASLWAVLVFEVTLPLWADMSHSLIHIAWDAGNTALLFAGIAILLRAAPRPLRWSVQIEIAALALMAVLMFYEVARYLGWVPVESTQLRQFHVPVMLLAIGVAIFERHLFAFRRAEEANLELERRVLDKTRQIEAYHSERESGMRQKALEDERQRIVSDMHDGLGASLVGLLHYVKSRPADTGGIEQRVKEALQEMRIAIDALEPAQGDLAGVLGNLRYRLEPLMEAAGMRLSWDVAEMPTVESLDPSAVFAIQRALLEAIFNALKHSGAREIRLAARPGHDGIEIRIEDDGRGFDIGQPGPGLGLGTMRARAQRLGGTCDIASKPGRGTTVTFGIPYRLAHSDPPSAPALASPALASGDG